MNGEADYWPSSAEFTAVRHAIQIYTNKMNWIDIRSAHCDAASSELQLILGLNHIVISSIRARFDCCCRPPSRLDWHREANGFWERQSHQQILRPCHEGSFFEYVHQGKLQCRTQQQQLKLPRSLTVFAIFCQSIMWPKKFHFSFGKSQSEYWHRSGSQIVIDFNVMSELRVFVQNSWGCSKKNLTG